MILTRGRLQGAQAEGERAEVCQSPRERGGVWGENSYMSLNNLLCRFPNILKNPLGASELLPCLKASTAMHKESNYRKTAVMREEPDFQMSFVDSNKTTWKDLHEKKEEGIRMNDVLLI